MRCGISTACFFPKDTAESLKILADSGVKVVEIFINTLSELEDGYVARLKDITSRYGMEVSSVHPCTSGMEGFFFASHYSRRLADGLEFYKRYYEACGALESDKLIFHGDHLYNTRLFSSEQYADNYRQLAAEGDGYGVTLCHENVAYCRLGMVKNVRALRPLLGERAAFVLDLKQLRRRGLKVEPMLRAMSGCIRQVHISDFLPRRNCLPPGAGQLDIAAFLRGLGATGYTGDLIIELYEDNFNKPSELLKAMQLVNSLL